VIIGIDVGKFNSVFCAISATGEILAQDKLETDLGAFQRAIHDQARFGRRPKVVAMESGSLPRRLCLGLRRAGYKSIIIDARQASPFLRSLRRQKTDANDAYAIAEIVRLNAHRETWIRSSESVRRLELLNVRDLIVRSEVSVRNSLISYLASAGHNVKAGDRNAYIKAFEARAAEPEGEFVDLYCPLLKSVKHSSALISELDAAVRTIVKKDQSCQLLMSTPGVGPLTVLRYVSYLDDPLRFATSREVGAYVGLVPKLKQSGGIKIFGGITKSGSNQLRRSLFLASRTLMFSYKSDCSLQRWAKAIAKRRGTKCAMTALARKLAVTLHAMWISETPFHFSEDKQNSPIC
jgi:transposase